MLTEIRRAESYDLTTLSVALRQLRNLALTSRSTFSELAPIVSRHPAHKWPWNRSVAWTGPMPPRYRFAPSPTGIFHVGGARTALYNWALAKQQAGTFVLRIEDTDEVRNHPEWTEGIVDGLAWLGIAADDADVRGAVLPELLRRCPRRRRRAALRAGSAPTTAT